MSTTLKRLSVILQRDYAVSPEQLSMDATLDELGIDSLGVVELLFTVEDEFKLSIPSEPVTMQNLGDVVRYIDQLLITQAPPPAKELTPEKSADGSTAGNYSVKPGFS